MSGRSRPARRPASVPRRTERITISSIAAGGEGVGRASDGRAVFVHRTAPGEIVDVEIRTERARWARGRLLRVLESSPDRRDPPCPHYADCGGCTLEHLQYGSQLEIKARIVADALRRIGEIAVPLPEVVPSPRQIRYRNRVSFSLHRAGSGRVHAGFHALHDASRIVSIDGRCLLPEEPIGAVWDGLRAAWGPAAHRLPSGERLRLTLRASSEGGVSLLIEGGYSPGRPDELLAAVEGLDAIWHRPERSTAAHVAGARGLPESWGTETFELGATAFVQVNRQAAALLEEHVVAVAGVVSGIRIIDAYCGIGLIARRLVRAGATVVGVELNPEAVRVATETALPGSAFHTGRVEDLLEEHLPADLLILNPPRSGLDVGVIDAILQAPPGRIVYISCDPATLARDLRRLMAAYVLRELRCFDLFPQTAHVESVAVLEPNR